MFPPTPEHLPCCCAPGGNQQSIGWTHSRDRGKVYTATLNGNQQSIGWTHRAASFPLLRIHAPVGAQRCCAPTIASGAYASVVWERTLQCACRRKPALPSLASISLPYPIRRGDRPVAPTHLQRCRRKPALPVGCAGSAHFSVHLLGAHASACIYRERTL